jgi:arsenate reductase
MKEAGVDITSHKPKSVDVYLNTTWDYVITVCDNANETCPVFRGKVSYRLHFGFEDPSDFKGTEEEILYEFRRIRDKIKMKFEKFYNENLI